MTQDEERWAEALAVERLHSGRATVWVAERNRSLNLVGDTVGGERFQPIAHRLAALHRTRVKD